MGDDEATIGGAGAAHAASTAIARQEWEAWLGELTPAQLDVVLAEAIVYGPPLAIPVGYRERAFALGPTAARLASSAEAEGRARPPAPPLVRTPDGALLYSAGGQTYRPVVGPDGADRLGLNPAGAVDVAKPALPIGPAWSPTSTASSAFATTGRLVASRGDVAAAFAFAGLWRRHVSIA